MGYRVSVYNDDIAADFATAAAVAAGAGVDGLAIRNVWGRNIATLERTELELVRKVADEHGLAFTAVGSPYGRGFYLDSDDDQRAAEAVLGKMFAVGEILGCDVIRIFALWLRDHESYASWAIRPDLDECLDRLAGRLRPSVEMARRAGVTLMIETEGASYVGQVREARELFERLGANSVVLCWDVANAWRSGEQPLDGLHGARALPLADVNVKDLVAEPGRPDLASDRRAVVGEGSIPYGEIVATLLHDGYDGVFTVERNYYPRRPEDETRLQEDIVKDIANLHELLRVGRRDDDSGKGAVTEGEGRA